MVTLKIKTVSVIGIGTMGYGIAVLCAHSGLNVVVYDKSDTMLDKGFKNMELKQKIFQQLDEFCPESVILSTCTSGLSPTAIAKDTKHPERIVVAHFWNPPQLIPLVEVVPDENTSQETVTKTVEWVEFIGKKAIKFKGIYPENCKLKDLALKIKLV